MKVVVEYANNKIACIEDVLDVVFCTYDVEIYLKRDDVAEIPTSKIKGIKVTDF